MWSDGRRELYALDEDPREQNDRSATELEKVRSLEADLAKVLGSGADRRAGADETVDEKHKRRLRALGYIQ